MLVINLHDLFCLVLSFKWHNTGWCLGFLLESTRIFFLFVPHCLQYPIDFRSTSILVIILGVHIWCILSNGHYSLSNVNKQKKIKKLLLSCKTQVMNVDIIISTHVNSLDELRFVANNASIWISSYSPSSIVGTSRCILRSCAMSPLVFKLEYKSSADGYCKENVNWTKKNALHVEWHQLMQTTFTYIKHTCRNPLPTHLRPMPKPDYAIWYLPNLHKIKL